MRSSVCIYVLTSLALPASSHDCLTCRLFKERHHGCLLIFNPLFITILPVPMLAPPMGVLQAFRSALSLHAFCTAIDIPSDGPGLRALVAPLGR